MRRPSFVAAAGAIPLTALNSTGLGSLCPAAVDKAACAAASFACRRNVLRHIERRGNLKREKKRFMANLTFFD
jgi:hypothetical protein